MPEAPLTELDTSAPNSPLAPLTVPADASSSSPFYEVSTDNDLPIVLSEPPGLSEETTASSVPLSPQFFPTPSSVHFSAGLSGSLPPPAQQLDPNPPFTSEDTLPTESVSASASRIGADFQAVLPEVGSFQYDIAERDELISHSGSEPTAFAAIKWDDQVVSHVRALSTTSDITNSLTQLGFAVISAQPLVEAILAGHSDTLGSAFTSGAVQPRALTNGLRPGATSELDGIVQPSDGSRPRRVTTSYPASSRPSWSTEVAGLVHDFLRSIGFERSVDPMDQIRYTGASKSDVDSLLNGALEQPLHSDSAVKDSLQGDAEALLAPLSIFIAHRDPRSLAITLPKSFARGVLTHPAGTLLIVRADFGHGGWFSKSQTQVLFTKARFNPSAPITDGFYTFELLFRSLPPDKDEYQRARKQLQSTSLSRAGQPSSSILLDFVPPGHSDFSAHVRNVPSLPKRHLRTNAEHTESVTNPAFSNARLPPQPSFCHHSSLVAYMDPANTVAGLRRGLRLDVSRTHSFLSIMGEPFLSHRGNVWPLALVQGCLLKGGTESIPAYQRNYTIELGSDCENNSLFITGVPELDPWSLANQSSTPNAVFGFCEIDIAPSEL